MHVSPLLLRHQLPVLKTLGTVMIRSLGKPPAGDPDVPGQLLEQIVNARPDGLIELYRKWSGDDHGRYDHTVPPHLFSQWGFPLMAKTIEKLPWKLTGVLNQGCRVAVQKPLERGRPLYLSARLAGIENDGFKVGIHQHLTTGHKVGEVLQEADLFAVILLKKTEKDGQRVPESLDTFKEIGSWSAALNDGRNYGFLTGDLNPIHWIGPYAKMAGFKRQILHGFGSFARSWALLEDQMGTIHEIDVRFVRPLVLPARTRLLVSPHGKEPTQIRLLDKKDAVCLAGTVRFA